MSEIRSESGMADINGAEIYYELAGQGWPFVMVHAGVADSRQWNNEFPYLVQRFRVLRYDMRGYGKSEPITGQFSHLQDLKTLFDYLELDGPFIMMGCSMGGGMAMDFALSNPQLVRALIMVGSAPSGLELDTPNPAKFEQAEQAYNDGDLDRVAELETQIWFDGEGRTPEQVDPVMRRLAYEMDRLALAHESKRLGTKLPDSLVPAVERLDQLQIPVLVVVGTHDTPFLLAAADYMVDAIPNARKAIIQDAAHLPNMDQPAEFLCILTEFLDTLPD
jgi:2-hydroxy-6-oxonona-2,4-dienedioate hydrolase